MWRVKYMIKLISRMGETNWNNSKVFTVKKENCFIIISFIKNKRC